MSKIAPNFGHFSPSQILTGGLFAKVVFKLSSLPSGTHRVFREVTPTIPKVTGAQKLNFERKFKTFTLNIFGRIER